MRKLLGFVIAGLLVASVLFSPATNIIPVAQCSGDINCDGVRSYCRVNADAYYAACKAADGGAWCYFEAEDKYWTCTYNLGCTPHAN